MMDLRTVIAERVKSWRGRRGLTQEKLAEKAGLSWNFIAVLETKGKTPSLETLSRIAKALDIEVVDLLSRDEDTALLQHIKHVVSGLKKEHGDFVLGQLTTWAEYLRSNCEEKL